jgi:hypothetical protein
LGGFGRRQLVSRNSTPNQCIACTIILPRAVHLPAHMSIVTGLSSALFILSVLSETCIHADIDDEFHVVFKCNFVSDLRIKYLKKYYYITAIV